MRKILIMLCFLTTLITSTDFLYAISLTSGEYAYTNFFADRENFEIYSKGIYINKIKADLVFLPLTDLDTKENTRLKKVVLPPIKPINFEELEEEYLIMLNVLYSV